MRAGLIAAAHHQLHAPVILISDNLNTHISTVVRNRLKRIQYRPALIGEFLAQTGLSL
jgi:hypothetical protein